MPIQIDQFKSKPSVDYKYLHMQECSIRIAATEELNPKTEIRAVFIPYGFDETTNKKIFDPSGRIVLQEPDFLTLAQKMYVMGKDPSYLQAFLAMETAMTNLLTLRMPKIVGSAEQIM